MAERIEMKINSKDFRVRTGEKVKINEWPTRVKPFCKSKKRYQKLLGEHVKELSPLQRLHRHTRKRLDARRVQQHPGRVCSPTSEFGINTQNSTLCGGSELYVYRS